MVGFDAAICLPLLMDVYFQWDQSSTDVFQVLNECDSAQVRIEVMYIRGGRNRKGVGSRWKKVGDMKEESRMRK